MHRGTVLKGFGKALPKKTVSNDELSKIVDTSDEWIKSRVGISSRNFIQEGEDLLSLCVQAGREAMDDAAVQADDISLVIVASFSSPSSMPNTAAMVQAELGLPTSPMMAFDLNAACSGFVYALSTALALLRNQPKKLALVIGAETLSPLLDFEDRSTCILFGDGAGAVVVGLDEEKNYYDLHGAQGDTAGDLICPGPAADRGPIQMKGSAIYRFAVRIVPQLIQDLADLSDNSPAIYDRIVCHQANSRILRACADRLELEPERFYEALAQYGNTSAASIPIALYDLAREGGLKEGMRIALVGFGGGLTWGGIDLEL